MSRPDPAAPRPAGLPQGLTLMVLPLLVMMGAVMIGPVLPAIQAEFARTPNADLLVPLLLTTPSIAVALFSPLAAVIVGRVGARRVLLVSLSVYAFAGMAPMVLGSLTAILASRLLVGISEAGLVTAATVFVAGYFAGGERQKWFAYQNAFLSFMGAVLILTSGVIAAGGWRASFSLYGIALVMLVLAARFLFEPPAPAGRRPAAALPGLSDLLLIASIAVVGSIAFYLTPIKLAFLLIEKGFQAPATAGLVAGLSILFGPIGPLLSRRMTHLPVSLMLFIAFAAMGVGVIVMALATTVPLITAGMALQQIGGGLLLTTGITFVMSIAGEDRRSSYTGVWFFLYMASQFLTPLFLALLGRFVSGEANVLLAAGGVLVAVSFAYLAVPAFRRPVVDPAGAAA